MSTESIHPGDLTDTPRHCKPQRGAAMTQRRMTWHILPCNSPQKWFPFAEKIISKSTGK
jgi:hypothetical protein